MVTEDAAGGPERPAAPAKHDTFHISIAMAEQHPICVLVIANGLFNVNPL